MKKITVLFVLLFSMMLNAQVGVNTTNPDPSSMLDITATNKGVLVPRVSLANVTTTMLDGTNTAATGLLIWNTNAATTGGNGIGFYYFNGTQWMPITQTIPTDADWHEVGTSNPPDNINDNIFTNGNVGIGTINPANRLDVVGGTSASVNRLMTIRSNFTTANTGTGLALINSTSGISNVGSEFESVTTNASGLSHLRFKVHGGGGPNGALLERMRILGNGNVGIGTDTPLDRLHIAGNIRMVDGNQAVGRVMKSNANGTASWQDDNDNQNLSLVGNNLSISNGNTINLSSVNTDNQFIDTFSLVGNILGLSIQNDGQPVQTVNLSSINTDDQNLVTPTLVGTTLNLNIENGTGTSIDLAPLQDGTGTDDQNIQNLGFNAATNILTVGIENGTSQTVSLAALATGGDIQGVTAGAGLTGGGTTGTVTVTAAANNGLNVDTVADNIQLGGPLVENTTISQGIYSLDINLDSTGDFSIQDNGTDVFFVEDTGDIGIGTSNPAYPLHIVENVAATTYGVYIDKADNSTSQTSGLYIQKTGTGTGRSHAIFTNVDGAGTGQKYGIFNNINSSANGNQYGTRNFINSATPSFIFGTFNNLDNAGTGNQYGVYNGMRGIAATNLYGTYNEFNSPSITNETAGVYNSFSDGTPGTGGIMGVFSEFSNSNNGVYYGSRNSFTNAATGTGTKYGTYNLISATAGGTHFGTFNSVSVANGWAGYFLGRNYISDRLSIGITDNPNAALNINKNSTGTYAHIELTEAQANDGARIRFNNSVETTNNWVLYGRADDTNSDSTFNIFNNISGNVVVVNGEGRVGIMRNPATNALEVEGNASKNVAGGWLANSDSRLKKNIATISPNDALEKILQLRGVTYHWNDDKTGTNRPKNLQMGFIAQEIAEIFPEKVTEDNLGFLQTAYGDYDPIVFQAIKALNDKIEKLENENSALKSALKKVNALEAKLEQMNLK
jgi:hypothetical protein